MTPDELEALLAAGAVARSRLVTDARDPKARLRSLARKVALLWRASELAYESELRTIFQAFHAAYTAALEQHGIMSLYDPRLGAVEVHYLIQLRSKVGTAFDRVAPGMRKASRESAQYTLRGISSTEQGLGDVMTAARERSILLVERAGRAYASDVRAVLGDPENFNLTAKGLRDLLVERGNVSLSRADLISRDQTLKVASALTVERMRRAGVDSYEWSGVMDTRERDSHVELEGRVFGIDEATPIGYRPGEDYQCRCIPIVRVPELD